MERYGIAQKTKEKQSSGEYCLIHCRQDCEKRRSM